MSKKENLMKFWESMESNKRWQGGSDRRETGAPQRLAIDRMLHQKLPVCLDKKEGREKEEVKPALPELQQKPDSASTSTRTQDQTFPCLPRY